VVFESEKIVAVNKAPGITVGGQRWEVAPGAAPAGAAGGIPAERLDKLLLRDLGCARLFTVHRIDKDTSGLVLFAKDEQSHKLLSRAFEERQVGKRYIAVVHGRPAWEETTCSLALVPDGNKQHKTIVDKYRGKKSLTHFTLLGSAGNYSVLEARPKTGRTHQIRVHAAELGFPVVCDSLYGRVEPVLLSSFKRGWRGDLLAEKPLLSRLGLHALELSLPEDALGCSLTAPFPRDMLALIKQMEKQGAFKKPSMLTEGENRSML